MGWVRGEPWCCPSWGAMGWGWGQRGGTGGGRSQSGFPHEVLSRCGAIRCSPKGATFLGICGAGLGAVGQCQGRGRRGEQGGLPHCPQPQPGLPMPPSCTCPLWPCCPGAASLRGPLAAGQSRLSRALQPRRPRQAGPVGTQPALFNRAWLVGPRAAGVLWVGDGSVVLCFPHPHAGPGLFLWEWGLLAAPPDTAASPQGR